MQHTLALADVLSGGPNIVADGYLIADRDFVKWCAIRASLHLVGVLEWDYGVGAVWDGCAGHDADCAAGGNIHLGEFARGDCSGDLERDGVVCGCAAHVGCLKRVAVHGGVVEGWDVVGCERVFGEHLPYGFEQWCPVGFQRVEVAHDALEGVFDAEHSFAIVAVAMASCVSPVVLIVIVLGVSVCVARVCSHSTSLLAEIRV